MNIQTLPTRTVEVLTARSALNAVQAALAAGADMGVPVSVAVCDPSMGLIAFAKADGATPHSVDTSRRKAQTAASTGKPTGWMQNELAITLPLASDNKLTNVPGGIPIRYNGALVGALGIAGGTIAQDRTIAEAALTLIHADPML
ncbi:MAG: heme-binding protein [Candidatus Doudnabacteria bacterium]|nr:heme-binding protein [Candidatus Doudnabacteria bacterium]